MERKHFKRKRVNTKTPSRNSSAIIISTANMTLNIAIALIDSIGKIVPQDQIKNCNIEVEK